MFGIGGPELLIIVVVALIVIGPKKLPEMMRSLGKGLAEIKNVGNDVKSTLDREIKSAEDEKKREELKEELKREMAAEAKKKEGGEKAESSGKTEATKTDSGASSSEPKEGQA